jgi:putative endonuclease
MYFIYILYSAISDRYYTGYTLDVAERVAFHNENTLDKATGKSKEWQLQAVFSVSDVKEDAVKIEMLIKKQKSRSLILKLTDPAFTPEGALEKLIRVAI